MTRTDGRSLLLRSWAFVRRNLGHLSVYLYYDLPFTVQFTVSLVRVMLRRLLPSRLDGRPIVVFHEKWAKHRVANQARALRASGQYQTILFTWQFHLAELDPSFDEIRIGWSVNQMGREVRSLEAAGNLHSLVCSTTDLALGQACLDENWNVPLVVSTYDSYWSQSHFRKSTSNFDSVIDPRMVQTEQAVLPACAGVLARWGDVPILFAENGVNTPYIKLWDLCDPASFAPIRGTPREAGEWHVVSAGIVFPMSFSAEAFGDGQMVRYASAFREERVHLHVHPSPHFPFSCPEYRRENRENPYFHLHRGVPPRQACRVIGSYDFGWLGFDFKMSGMNQERYYREMIPLRAFGYLEAGIPLLTSESCQVMADLVKKYGCGLVLPEPRATGMRQLIKDGDYGEMCEGVERARKALTAEGHSSVLTRFLEGSRDRFMASRPPAGSPG